MSAERRANLEKKSECPALHPGRQRSSLRPTWRGPRGVGTCYWRSSSRMSCGVVGTVVKEAEGGGDVQYVDLSNNTGNTFRQFWSHVSVPLHESKEFFMRLVHFLCLHYLWSSNLRNTFFVTNYANLISWDFLSLCMNVDDSFWSCKKIK